MQIRTFENVIEKPETRPSRLFILLSYRARFVRFRTLKFPVNARMSMQSNYRQTCLVTAMINQTESSCNIYEIVGEISLETEKERLKSFQGGKLRRRVPKFS